MSRYLHRIYVWDELLRTCGKIEGGDRRAFEGKTGAHSGLVFLRAQGKVKNVHEIGTLKQDIARIATYQRSVRAQSQKT